MKRLTALLLATILMLTLSTTALADVIWIPEDPFLEDHMAECVRIDRSYRTLTEVTVYENPESIGVEGTLPQGDAVGIYYIYTDENGNQWGYCEKYESEIHGWVAMAYMDLIYDYISFNEDYGDTFLDEDGRLSEEFADDTVWFWNYPGSDTGEQFDMDAWAGDYLPEYDTVYQDEQGRSWGYVSYYFGFRHFWICLDAPTADFDTLFPDGEPQVEITSPDETIPTLPAKEIVPQPSSGTKRLQTGIAIAVVICVAITGTILVKMKRKA